MEKREIKFEELKLGDTVDIRYPNGDLDQNGTIFLDNSKWPMVEFPGKFPIPVYGSDKIMLHVPTRMFGRRIQFEDIEKGMEIIFGSPVLKSPYRGIVINDCPGSNYKRIQLESGDTMMVHCTDNIFQVYEKEG